MSTSQYKRSTRIHLSLYGLIIILWGILLSHTASAQSTAPAGHESSFASYQRIYDGLSKKGLYGSDARLIAAQYSSAHRGDFERVADAALAGDSKALQWLRNGNWAKPRSQKLLPVLLDDSALKIYAALSKKGLDNDNANQIASQYSNDPHGKTAELVDAALSGDQQALLELKKHDWTVVKGPAWPELSAKPQYLSKTLVCYDDSISTHQQLASIIELNEDEKTAVISIYASGESSGPLAATYSPQAITVDWKKSSGSFLHYTVNRKTWALLTTEEGKPGAQHDTCHVDDHQPIER